MDRYIVVDEETSSLHTAILSGNMKQNKIYVGDIVVINKSYDVFVINSVIERKNFVIRPPVANIDQMILCISIDKPKPDYMLLDKQIVLCISKNIIPILCINKIDLIDSNLEYELKYIHKVYGFLKIVEVSSKTEQGLPELINVLALKTSAFSGNSGVGKSSIISKILGENLFNIEVGQLSSKIDRGRHTTKYIKLYSLENFGYILDTPGFSSYELFDIKYDELKEYYPEFKRNICSYLNCNHINESDDECTVKSELKLGNIDEGRYNRYNQLYTLLKQKDDLKYKTKSKKEGGYHK